MLLNSLLIRDSSPRITYSQNTDEIPFLKSGNRSSITPIKDLRSRDFRFHSISLKAVLPTGGSFDSFIRLGTSLDRMKILTRWEYFTLRGVERGVATTPRCIELERRGNRLGVYLDDEHEENLTRG